jgi:hypothetical protein
MFSQKPASVSCQIVVFAQDLLLRGNHALIENPITTLKSEIPQSVCPRFLDVKQLQNCTAHSKNASKSRKSST